MSKNKVHFKKAKKINNPELRAKVKELKRVAHEIQVDMHNHSIEGKERWDTFRSFMAYCISKVKSELGCNVTALWDGVSLISIVCDFNYEVNIDLDRMSVIDELGKDPRLSAKGVNPDSVKDVMDFVINKCADVWKDPKYNVLFGKCPYTVVDEFNYKQALAWTDDAYNQIETACADMNEKYAKVADKVEAAKNAGEFKIN